MIDPLSPLFHATNAAVGDIIPGAADPTAAHGLMVVGLAIILINALWAAGGLGAAAWMALSRHRRRRFHPAPRALGRRSVR